MGSDLETLAYLYGAVEPEYCIWPPDEAPPNIQPGTALSPATELLRQQILEMSQSVPVCDPDTLQRLKADFVRLFGREPQFTHLQSADRQPAHGNVNPNEERDRWLYEQRQSGLTWDALFVAFKECRVEKRWQAVAVHGIRTAVKRYAAAHRLPLTTGRSGRPKRAK